MPPRPSSRHAVTLAVGDLLLSCLALVAARVLRLALPWGRPLDAAGAALPWALWPLSLGVWAVALTLAGAYDPQRLQDGVSESQAVLVGVAVAAAALAGVLYIGHRELSRLLYAYFVALDALLTLGWRLSQRRRAHPIPRIEAVTIGLVERTLKRAFDLGVAIVALAVCAPPLGALALAIALSSPGPVLYRSRRIGEGGRPFTMLKLRTMRVGAEAAEEELLTEAEDGQLVFRKQPDDPRVTPLGRWLRRTSLDELPQLVNVVRGEMSLVGPRPELPALVARYTPRQRQRLSVPQGMTGWWQVCGRSERGTLQHIEDDLYYIEHYTLLLDAHILWRTLGAVIRGRGAY